MTFSRRRRCSSRSYAKEPSSISRPGGPSLAPSPDVRACSTDVESVRIGTLRSPLPLGEVDAQNASGEGLQAIDRPEPPHPNPLPDGEREQAEFAACTVSNSPEQTLEARGKHEETKAVVARLTRRTILASGVGAVLAARTAHAQRSYPRKPIVLVVSFAPGGGTDVLARIAAKYMGEELGQPVNVANKPGGNSIPASMFVMEAAPDGYTLLFDSPATSSLHALVDDVPYKPLQRTWGPLVTAGPYIFAVNAKSEWKGLKDLAEAGRRDPSSLRISWIGGNSLTDTMMLKLL